MRYILFLLFALGLAEHASAQTDRRAVQVTGAVVATDSLVPVPFATIYRAHDHRGTYTDQNGYFTMPAEPGDTLFFSYIGLKLSYYPIPLEPESDHLSIIQWMEVDTTPMAPLVIYPYPMPHLLRGEVLALDLPGDGYFRFDRDAASVANFDGLADLTAAAQNESAAMAAARYTSGFRSGGNLLDAASWGRFMNSIRSRK